MLYYDIKQLSAVIHYAVQFVAHLPVRMFYHKNPSAHGFMWFKKHVALIGGNYILIDGAQQCDILHNNLAADLKSGCKCRT